MTGRQMWQAGLEPFGVEVGGLDVAAIPASKAACFAHLISQARVAVFRDQTLDDAAFVRFLCGFGALAFTAGETPVAHAPDLNVVSNVGRPTPPRSVFHTDTSYVPAPPSFTALRPVVLPRAGGPTLFTDQVAAGCRLPPNVREWLQGRTVLHRSSGLAGRTQATRHPLFRKHPTTGETALYLSTPERCIALSGVDEPTSERVIGLLYWHCTRSSRVYRHRWRQGDLLIWDNRVTMHRADHEAVSGDRVFHRGMVAGEVPLQGAIAAGPRGAANADRCKLSG